MLDRNAFVTGSAITHNNNSADIIIQEKGVYYVSYSVSVFPADKMRLPVANLLTLTLNGNPLSGGTAQDVFYSDCAAASQASSRVVEVTDVPAVLRLVNSGGTFGYSNVTVNVFKL